MKYVFVIGLLVLVAASVGLRLSFPDAQTARPVIYWVTDPNPAREEQAARFHEWLVAEGHVDDRGEPVVELRLDVANRDTTKQVIQSVSGVGGDLMDLIGQEMYLFEAMGVIADVTDDAERLGFGPDQTYDAIAPQLMVHGRQYRYPANVGVALLWVNEEALRRFGLEPPAERWTWDEFEALGVAFRDRANPPGTPAREKRYLLNWISLPIMARSLGLSVMNETLTASALDDPRWVRTLETYRRWVYDLNIIPTADDTQAFATEQNYGGSALTLFGRGQIAMIAGGRHNLIQLRRYDQIDGLRVVEMPHAGFPNTTIETRGVALYADAKHPELAKLFLAYLASDTYSQTIVEDADALPPNPRLTTTDAYLRPEGREREWQAHGMFVRSADTIAIGKTFSPYILPPVMDRIRTEYEQSFLNNQLTAEEAARRTAEATDRRIADNLRRKPELRERFAQDLALQEKIDALKAAGEPIPEAWIKNVFHRAYYRHTGQLAPSPDAGPTPTD
ncbi:MAG: extracellular solute-binding protein [Planctomycetota bacterium]